MKRGNLPFLFHGKTSALNHQNALKRTYRHLPQFSHGDIPRPSLEGGGAEVGWRKEERGGCIMAAVTRIARQHLQWLDPPGNHKVVCFQLFPSEVSRHFDEVTHRGT